MIAEVEYAQTGKNPQGTPKARLLALAWLSNPAPPIHLQYLYLAQLPQLEASRTW